MYRLTVFQLMVLSSFIIPGLVALVTAKVSAGWVKQLTLIVLSAAAAVIATIVADVDFNVKQALTLFGTLIITSSATYFGLDNVVYLPLARKTADVGIGKSTAKVA